MKSKDTGGSKPVVTVTRATDRKQYRVLTGTVDKSFAEEESAAPQGQAVGTAPTQSTAPDSGERPYELPFGTPFGTARAEIPLPDTIVSPVPQAPR